MKPPSRNKTLLAQLKQERDRISAPPEPDAATDEGASAPHTAPPEALPPPPAANEPPDAQTPWPPALVAQTGPGRWTRRELLATLAASLPPDFPAIQHGDEEICPRGVFRWARRGDGGTVVRLSYPGGVREFAPVQASEAFQSWLAHFARRQAADPARDASRLCCADLVKNLETFEDYRSDFWVKRIDPAAWCPVVPGT